MLKGFTRAFKPLEILTEDQVEAIHRGTLDVLSETGVRFDSDWALNFFKKNERAKRECYLRLLLFPLRSTFRSLSSGESFLFGLPSFTIGQNLFLIKNRIHPFTQTK